MRLAADDVTRSLRASWRLLRAESQALPGFDLSRQGFWSSYAALLLTVPAMIPTLAAQRLLAHLPDGENLFAAPLLAASVAGAQLATILAVPLLLLALAPAMRRDPRFTGFVIAWNWSGVLAAGLMAVPAAVFAIGWSNPQIALLQSLGFAAIVLRLRYCVARAAFGGGNGIAAAIACASALADYAVLRTFGLAAF